MPDLTRHEPWFNAYIYISTYPSQVIQTTAPDDSSQEY